MLTRLAEISGGRTFSIGRITELDAALDVIREELENQYLIGYTPSNTARDGSYRRIRWWPPNRVTRYARVRATAPIRASDGER